MNQIFSIDKETKITPLRKDILAIISSAKIPLSAYEILNKLRKKRPNAEPPTVYRVLDYLVKQNSIHKIESNSKFVSCSQLDHNESEHHGILFNCKKCFNASEFANKNLFQAIQNFCKKKCLIMDHSLIEIKGICQKCAKLK